MLNKLDIKHQIYKQKSNDYLIEMKGKKALEKWASTIKFNNPVQQTRYEIFKKHGFVPPKTTLAQRKQILAGKLNPRSFYDGPVA